MGVLSNFDHERFCQLVHKRIWAGEKQVEACEAAYREAICEGADNTKPTDFAANVRKLRNRPEIKARLQELADYAAKLAGIDAGWAQLKLRDMVEANLDDFLGKPNHDGSRHFDIGRIGGVHQHGSVDGQRRHDSDGRLFAKRSGRNRPPRRAYQLCQ